MLYARMWLRQSVSTASNTGGRQQRQGYETKEQAFCQFAKDVACVLALPKRKDPKEKLKVFAIYFTSIF